MASWLSLILLSVAVSLDGFGAGVTYGIRKIRIPPLSIAIISACSGLMMFLAMMAGTLLSRLIPPETARAAGALLLVAAGCWALIQFLRNESGGHEADGSNAGSGARENDARRNPMIRILQSPQAADLDRSGAISGGEAVLLGAALSLDALAAGVGAAMAGFPPLAAALCIALASGAFLHLGTRFGFKMAHLTRLRPLAVLPGLLLILMGIFKLL
mgnify:CR=1 FL=1